MAVQSVATALPTSPVDTCARQLGAEPADLAGQPLQGAELRPQERQDRRPVAQRAEHRLRDGEPEQRTAPQQQPAVLPGRSPSSTARPRAYGTSAAEQNASEPNVVPSAIVPACRRRTRSRKRAGERRSGTPGSASGEGAHGGDGTGRRSGRRRGFRGRTVGV